MGDWVVTPRRGKAVEINALWYNALRLLERWVHDELADEVKAAHLAMHAERTRDSFNRRFWNPEAGCLYDVVDGESGDDPSCRPNQILAISLRNPVLDQAYCLSLSLEIKPLIRNLMPRQKILDSMCFGPITRIPSNGGW